MSNPAPQGTAQEEPKQRDSKEPESTKEEPEATKEEPEAIRRLQKQRRREDRELKGYVNH